MSKSTEFSGNNVNYYLVDIKDPKRLAPYQAECEDIIEALGMTFAEGCAFKAIWRSCAARTLGLAKNGQDAHGIYDAEKVEYYAKRMIAFRQRMKALDASVEVVPVPAFDPSIPVLTNVVIDSASVTDGPIVEIRTAHVPEFVGTTPEQPVPNSCSTIEEVMPSVKCPHIFGSIACGHTGRSAKICDKSFDFCNSVGNAMNFGGFPPTL